MTATNPKPLDPPVEISCQACGHPLADADYARLRAERDALREENARLTREAEECRGVIETYGRAELLTVEERDVLELRYQVSGLVFKAGGMAVFGHALRECADRWEEKLRALRRAGMSTTERMFEAFADAERATRTPDHITARHAEGGDPQ